MSREMLLVCHCVGLHALSSKYKDMTLYDWVHCAVKLKIPKGRNKAAEDDGDLSDDEDIPTELQYHASDQKMRIDEPTSDDDYELGCKNQCRPKKIVRFLREHPQYATHTVSIGTEQKAKVPNFVGGALPRSDQGNREDYCMTMLTLFRPWCSGRS